MSHRPPEHFLAGEDDESVLKFKKYVSELGASHFMLTGENGRFLYEGKSHPSVKSSKYILGFSTGKNIKFVDVEQVFPMVQMVKKRMQAEKKEPVGAKPEETYFEKRAQLVEDFGTKKAKKKIASMLTNVVEVRPPASLTHGIGEEHRHDEGDAEDPVEEREGDGEDAP